MGTISINGNVVGSAIGSNSVVIAGGTVMVGGKVVASGLSGVVEIRWEGDLANLKCDAPLTVKGDVHGRVEADGPVTCGNVGGNLSVDGPVTCGNVAGNIEADIVTCASRRRKP